MVARIPIIATQRHDMMARTCSMCMCDPDTAASAPTSRPQTNNCSGQTSRQTDTRPAQEPRKLCAQTRVRSVQFLSYYSSPGTQLKIGHRGNQ